MIKKELLEILVCPKCRQNVRPSKDDKYMVCDKCNLLYEVKDDIPVMLIDSAIYVKDTETL